MVFEYFFLLHDSESQELKAKLLGFSKLKDNSNSKQTRIDLWEPFYYIIEIYIVHKRLPKKLYVKTISWILHMVILKRSNI